MTATISRDEKNRSSCPSPSTGDSREVDRFEPFANEDDLEFQGMGNVPNGEWVRFTDHIASLEAVERELHLMKSAGIIEVSIRNPSVADYMQHWEARATTAEARVAALTAERDALKEAFEWSLATRNSDD